MRMRMRAGPASFHGLWVLAAALCLAPASPHGSLAAQVRDPGAQRADLERRIREQFERRVRDELGMTPEAFAPVREILADLARARRGISLEERELRLRIQRFMISDDPARDAVAAEILSAARSLRERELALNDQELDRLEEHLTPTQILTLYHLRQELADRIERLRNPNAQRRRNPLLEVPGGLP